MARAKRGWRKRGAKPTAPVSTQIPLKVVARPASEVMFPDIEERYRESENIALLIEALAYCRVADTCPKWVADAAIRLLERERRGNGPTSKWSRQHERDLINLQRALAVTEGLRTGFTWEQSVAYACELLLGTPAGNVTIHQMEASYRLVSRQAAKAPGRFLLTATDLAWLSREFPRSSDRARRDGAVMRSHRLSAGDEANPLAVRLRSALPRSSQSAASLRELADLMSSSPARVRSYVNRLEGVERRGTGRPGDPVRYWRPRPGTESTVVPPR